MRFDWPGNVRQLLNVLRRAAIRSDRAVLDVDAVTASLADEPSLESMSLTGEGETRPQEYPRCVKDEVVRRALADADGSISRAARRLGIVRSTLRDRMQRFGIARVV